MTAFHRLPIRIAAALLSLLPAVAFSQDKVSGLTYFDTGTGGEADHEDFSFWVFEDGRKQVGYAYGEHWKEVKLAYLGPKPGAERTFSVRFPNALVLDIEVKGETLRVRNPAGRYDKTFRWRYEGPIEGRGMVCEPCVEEKDAAGFVTRNFAQ